MSLQPRSCILIYSDGGAKRTMRQMTRKEPWLWVEVCSSFVRCQHTSSYYPSSRTTRGSIMIDEESDLWDARLEVLRSMERRHNTYWAQGRSLRAASLSEFRANRQSSSCPVYTHYCGEMPAQD